MNMLDRHNEHLFLEKQDLNGNSFIANVNKTATNLDEIKKFNDYIEEGKIAELVEAVLVGIEEAGNKWLVQLQEVALALTAAKSAFNFATLVTIPEDIASGAEIELPDLAQYTVGTHMLIVSYNGTTCYIGEQYEEIGKIGETSKKIRMLFDLRANDKIMFRVIALNSETVLGGLPVRAEGSTEYRTLEERFGDIINVKDFGAVGDGVTDDTEAWNSWKAVSKGIKYVPSGKYLVDGSIRHFPLGCIGNVDAESFDYRWSQNVKDGNVINIGREWVLSNLEDCKNIAPVIAIENRIDTSNVSGYDNRAVCAYLTHTQEGNNPENKLFSTTLILGADNKAAGDNDVICFSSRATRYNVPGGIGDTAGTGGRIDTWSHLKGCAMGAEFASHIFDCGIPRPKDYGYVSTSKWVTPLHITGDSTNSPATAAILIQGKSGYNPFFDGIQFSYSMFKFAKNATFLINEIPNADGSENPNYPGEYVTTDENGHLEGTIAIDMGSFNEVNGYPDWGICFGYCKEHIAIPSGKRMNNLMTAMRIHSRNGAGLHLDADMNSSGNHSPCYVGFYNDDVLKGRIEYIPTNQSINIVNDAQDSGLTLIGTSFRPTTNGTLALGGPYNKFSEVYAQTGNINTSDERKKQSISDIPDKVLDAWGEVGFYEFRFNDSVERKGEKARFHTGLIAQRIKEIFEKHSIDPFKYGLLCYDKWEGHPDIYNEYDETIPAVYDEEGQIVAETHIVHHKELVEKAIEAGELYSIRYEEALCLEAAYQRRENEKLKNELANLQIRLNAIESKLGVK